VQTFFAYLEKILNGVLAFHSTSTDTIVPLLGTTQYAISSPRSFFLRVK